MSTATRETAVELPAGSWEVVLDTSDAAQVTGRRLALPPDSTVWLRLVDR
jgi:hypothetical protein